MVIQLLFRGQLPPSALALHPGHTAVIGGALLLGSCPAAEGIGRREGSGAARGDGEASSEALWDEVSQREALSVSTSIIAPVLGLESAIAYVTLFTL